MYQPSTPPSMPPHSGRAALRYGVAAGLCLGIVESAVIVFLTHNMHYYPLNMLSLPFSLLLWIIIFLLIGALAGKRTGRIIAGTLTGLWAGIVGGIITAVTFFATLMTSLPDYGAYGLVASDLTMMIILILAALGLGTGLGALGGLIGQSFFANPQSAPYHYLQRDVPQPDYRQGTLSQQELEQVQYSQNNSPRQDISNEG